MDVRVGVCGWTVSQSSYVRRFPVVEVQHTFYEPPADAVLTRWRSQVPASFEFTMKAWQVVTHESNSPTYRRLNRPLPDSARGLVGAFRTTPAVLEGRQRTLDCARAPPERQQVLQHGHGTLPMGAPRATREYIGSIPSRVSSTMSNVASGDNAPAARAAMPGRYASVEK